MKNNSVPKSGVVLPQYQQLFEEMVAGLVLLEMLEPHDGSTQDYRFLQVNRAWQEQIGLSAEATIGKPVSEVFSSPEDDWLDHLDRVSRTGQPEYLHDFYVEPNRYYQVSIFRPQVGLLALLFVDSTEQKCAEKQLSILLDRTKRLQRRTLKRLLGEIKKRRLQKKDLFLASSVFLHSSEGICITNTDGLIEKVNPAFTVITGYTSGEVVGKNPSILKSNYHSTEFYEEMWHRLKTHGSWCGEIWNRRKNGEVYSEYLAITAVTDDHDNILNYVALFHDNSELKASKDRALYQRLHDDLTGLPNRLLFVDHCENFLVRSGQKGESLALVLVDVDDFKNINESLGYAIGDLVLEYVGHRIVECCPVQDVVARMGGDQFALLIPDIRSFSDDVLLLGRRIMEELSASFTLEDQRIFLKVSIGIANFPEHGRTSHILLQNAEMALFKAKELGKNRMVVYSDNVREVVRRRIGLLRIMERLAQYGFSISIDDFGTGFSSLAYLKKFPITTLKIDRSFVEGLPDDSHDRTIVGLIMSLARSLGMFVVAEGVETKGQLDFLRQQHCDEFQGYLCSPPLPPEEFEQFIEKNKVWILG